MSIAQTLTLGCIQDEIGRMLQVVLDRVQRRRACRRQRQRCREDGDEHGEQQASGMIHRRIIDQRPYACRPAHSGGNTVAAAGGRCPDYGHTPTRRP